VKSCLQFRWLVAPAMVLVLGSSGRPADERAPGMTTAIGRYYGDWLRRCAKPMRPEIVEMFQAVAAGSSMGPGDGWFHPGQTSRGWDWVRDHYDANHDGKVTRAEFGGPAEFFDRLDRDRDGILTAADFDWSDRSALARESGQVERWARLMDANSNGRISRQEWESFFARAAQGKDYLTPDDLREALRPPPVSRRTGGGGPSPAVMIFGLLTGELGSMHEGPPVGARAPDFTLHTQDGRREIRLSDFQGHKPVVLVFGSFT
jgi:hypothetical protein